ncbi:MAG: proton-conducting transporter membrane subunit [Bacteroidales bacterium]|nr:proton-conducting transporter membrane subunit [Bacteroidales bacterium]MDD4670796.1 proton-conducting transporter membrane subunit [Bacteroidales bacterium]
MNLILLSFCLIVTALVVILFVNGLRVKTILAVGSVSVASVMIAIDAVGVLAGQPQEVVFNGGIVFGNVRIAMDALSAWFMLIIGIVFTAGAFYGVDYLKHYKEHESEIGLHIFAYLATFAAMMALCIIRNSLAFLVAWEVMALGSFVLIIFESWKRETIKAGINFFIQSHISVVLLTIGFLMMAAKAGSYDFEAIRAYSQTNDCTAAFILLFLGFAVKAGFVPFHTWLPHAHPAAPAHISGVMSGVIIKIGIFGILRMLTIFTLDFETVGYMILAISAVSGLYGVMLAIIQHNLKKLLAYHSIENIGIIGMGIGIECIGIGLDNNVMAALGFSGALIHTLNHALFKSSLFFAAGNIYHATHTLDVEQLGGLAKRLPMTAFLFLISSVAICGLPPMNGFVSEFLIYIGLFDWLEIAPHTGFVGAAFAILSLVMIGGLAILCFTKAFGIVFLGTPRTQLPPMKEFGKMRLAPMFIMAGIMLSIGLLPQLYTSVTDRILGGFGISGVTATVTPTISQVGIASMILLGVIGVLYLVRYLATRRKEVTQGETWGCGYTAATPKIQYTATSFVKTYKNLFSALLGPEDKIEHHLIDAPISAYRRFMGHFSFLQNGKLQFYILYGIIFIVLTIVLTFILS